MYQSQQAQRRKAQYFSTAGAVLLAILAITITGCTNDKGQVDTTQGNPANGPVTTDTSTASKQVSPVSNGPGSSDKEAAPANAGAGASAVTNNTPKEVPGGPGGTMMNKPSKNPMGALGDGEISLRVKNALIADTNIAARDINVDTKSQVVVLRGTQKTQAQIDAAVNDAKQIKGVDQVINQLKVK